MKRIVDELAGMRAAGGPPPPVPDELLANSLNQALQGTLTRALWDMKYSLRDVVRTHLWLWLAVRAALRNPESVNGELESYEDLIQSIVDAPAPVFPGLE